MELKDYAQLCLSAMPTVFVAYPTGDPMTTVPLTEAALEQAVIAMYTDVATVPDQEYHFWSGRPAAERFGYRLEWLEGAPRQAIDSFAGVGNPHRHAAIAAGDVVVDLGSGAGLDAF